MECGHLSARNRTSSPGQCSVCQCHLWQWRAVGGLAHQRPDISRTTDARTGHSYPRGTQRQCWPSCDLRSNMIAQVYLPGVNYAPLGEVGTGQLIATSASNERGSTSQL